MKNNLLLLGATACAIGSYAYYLKTQKDKLQTKKRAQQSAQRPEEQRERILASIKPEHKAQFSSDSFELIGKFQWKFYLGPVKQNSVHNFTSSYIDYQMTGKVYNISYRMHKLSYTDNSKNIDAVDFNTANKWIGQTDDGTVYVLFFKHISGQAVTIYKHKCPDGIAEALEFAEPNTDATSDHGWNVYSAEGVTEVPDNLAFSGVFYNDTQRIELADTQAVYQGNTYNKLTHHTGERRWVGQFNDTYLVVFYKHSSDPNKINQDNIDDNNNHNKGNIQLSVQVFDDIEHAYEIKHDAQSYQNFLLQE